MPESILVVRRSSPDDLQIRDLLVQVDHLPDFNLKFGYKREISLEPGEHTVSVTNRLYTKKATFTLTPGETVAFEVANYASGCMAAFFMGLGMGLYKVRLVPAAAEDHPVSQPESHP